MVAVRRSKRILEHGRISKSEDHKGRSRASRKEQDNGPESSTYYSIASYANNADNNVGAYIAAECHN